MPFLLLLLQGVEHGTVVVVGVWLDGCVEVPRVGFHPISDGLTEQGAGACAFDVGDLVGAVVIGWQVLLEQARLFNFRLMMG